MFYNKNIDIKFKKALNTKKYVTTCICIVVNLPK